MKLTLKLFKSNRIYLWTEYRKAFY